MRALRWIYPSIVGLLLGSLQTGLYFQLSFTLSSSIRTFLMVTVCWLLGSVIGVAIARRTVLPLGCFLALAVLMYFTCALLLSLAPFSTELWPAYAVFITLSGLYPGIFFIRMNAHYRARDLFFRENNGFIIGVVGSTLLFLVTGRMTLWIAPVLLAIIVAICPGCVAAIRRRPEVL